jgi:hypothetical protein
MTGTSRARRRRRSGAVAYRPRQALLQQQQAEDNVLVLGGIHAAARRVGHLQSWAL